MSEISEILENCLEDIEAGKSLETILAWYPDHKSELRLLLEASMLARNSRKHAVPDDVKRRGRERLLQYAAEMRESKIDVQRRMIPAFSRIAITLALVFVLALTSTGFVSASSGALPGDRLYPIKRTWEGMRLFFVSNPQDRDLLESQFEQERLNEIDELLGKKQSAPITFTGLVTRQTDGHWLVSGIPVEVSTMTNPSITAISAGAPVMIMGDTNSNGFVEAQQIQLLQSGGPLPPFEPSENSEPNGNGDQENPNSSSTPAPVVTQIPAGPGSQGSAPGKQPYQFSGVVQSMVNNVWVINGQTVYTGQAKITGDIKVGSVVKFDGNFDSGGRFLVTTVEDITPGNLSPHRNNSGSNPSGNSGSGSGDHEQPGGGGGDSGDDGGH